MFILLAVPGRVFNKVWKVRFPSSYPHHNTRLSNGDNLVLMTMNYQKLLCVPHLFLAFPGCCCDHLSRLISLYNTCVNTVVATGTVLEKGFFEVHGSSVETSAKCDCEADKWGSTWNTSYSVVAFISYDWFRPEFVDLWAAVILLEACAF